MIVVVVVIGKVAEVIPAATVTEAGTVASVLLALRLTTNPAVGAGPVIVTVPVVPAPPAMLAGLIVREVAVGAVTVRPVLTVVPPVVAEIEAVVVVAVGTVAIAKIAVVCPAAT